MIPSVDIDPRSGGTIWAVHLDDPRPVVSPRIRARFGWVRSVSPAAFTGADGSINAAEALSRLGAGRRCYAAWVHGRLAAYGWISFDEEYVGELNLRVRLIPGEAYIWDCFTFPAFRGNHLYTSLLDRMVRELGSDPLCRLWIGADITNAASQRGIARAGFRAVADMRVARVLAVPQVWVEGRSGIPESVLDEVRRAFLDNRDDVWRSALRGAPALPGGASVRNP